MSYAATLCFTVGAGGLFGLQMLKFSSMPSVSKSRVTKAPSQLHDLMQSTGLLVYAPFALFFVAMTMVDSFNPYFGFPAALGAAAIIVSGYQRIKFLRAPLWLGKQVTALASAAIFAFLMLGYGIVYRQKNVRDAQHVIHKF